MKKDKSIFEIMGLTDKNPIDELNDLIEKYSHLWKKN